MKLKAVAAEDLTKRKDVNDEEQRAKHGTLGDAVNDWGSGGGAVVDTDELLSVCEI